MTPPIPFFRLNGIEFEGRDERGVSCVSEVRSWTEGTPEAGIQAGVLALADSVMSYAAADDGATGFMPVTVSMHLEFQASPPPVGTALHGQATLESVQGDVLLVSGAISTTDAVVATGTLRSVLVPFAETPSSPQPSRVPVSLVPPIEASDQPTQGSLERVLALPAARSVGLTAAAAQPGLVELSLIAGPELERTDGVVHGGAIPIFGSMACEAVLELDGHARGARRLSLMVEYLRPTRIGEAIGLRARLAHRSRRLVTLHAELVNSAGKPTARVYETSLLTSGNQAG